MKTDDFGPSGENLQKLLNNVFHAIATNDHHGLIQTVREVCKDVSSEKASSDLFFNSDNADKDNTVITLASRTNS